MTQCGWQDVKIQLLALFFISLIDNYNNTVEIGKETSFERNAGCCKVPVWFRVKVIPFLNEKAEKIHSFTFMVST